MSFFALIPSASSRLRLDSRSIPSHIPVCLQDARHQNKNWSLVYTCVQMGQSSVFSVTLNIGLPAVGRVVPTLDILRLRTTHTATNQGEN